MSSTDPTAVADPPAEDIVDVEVIEEDQAPAAAKKVRARGKLKLRIRAAIATWWAYIAQPMSVQEAWERSGVIAVRRIPAEPDSKMFSLLFWAWWFSNRIDRPLFFLLIGVLPTWANGPLLWCAPRPSRRAGVYLVVLVLLKITVGG